MSLTEFFTNALHVACVSPNSVSPEVRAQAEECLLQLQNSNEGLDLAYHILVNEEFNDIRLFWAFNTFITHLPLIAVAQPEPRAQAVVPIYRGLMDWLRRAVVATVLPEHIRNKHAQVMVVGLQELHGSGLWGSFFSDLLLLLDLVPAAGEQVLFYFLRVCECIDERVVDTSQPRRADQRLRDGEIKDTMREGVVPTLVNVWFNILCTYHSQNVDLTRLCLSIVENYVDWIDVALVLNSNWINLLYFFMTNAAVRQGGCDCLVKLMEKKQLPALKLELVTAMRVVEALPSIVDALLVELSSGAALSGKEAYPLPGVVVACQEFTYSTAVGSLVVSTLDGLCACAEHGLEVSVLPAIRILFPQLVRLFTVPLYTISDVALPFLQNYIKSSLLDQEEAGSLLEVLFRKTFLPQDESFVFADEVSEQRRTLHNLVRLLYRKFPVLVAGHCAATVRRVLQLFSSDSGPATCGSSSNGCSGTGTGGGAGGGGAMMWTEAEAALRYLFELGEAVKLDLLRDPSTEFYALVRDVVTSGIVDHPSPLVSLAYFELLDRFHIFFQGGEYVSTLLSHLLAHPAGVTNRHQRVCQRICYLFTHLVQVLKNVFSMYSSEIASSMLTVLATDQTPHLGATEKTGLYAGLGCLLAKSDLSACARVVDRIASDMMQRCRPPFSEAVVAALADDIGYLTAVAKGVGGGMDATRLTDSPNHVGGAGGGAAAAAAVSGGAGSATGASGACNLGGSGMFPAASFSSNGVSPLTQVFLKVTHAVHDVLEACIQSSVIRDRTCAFLQQVVNVLLVDALPALSTCVPRMLTVASLNDLPKVLRVVIQAVSLTRGCSAVLLGDQLLPMVVAKVSSLCDVDALQRHHGVLSESAREHGDVFKHFFLLLHAIVQGNCITCFAQPASRECIPVVLDALARALRTSPEMDASRHALIVTIRLTQEWCTPESEMEAFMFRQLVPTLCDVLTSQSFDLKDSKCFSLVCETLTLFKTISQALGDRGLYSVFAILTALPLSIEHNAAHQLCSRVKEDIRLSAAVKSGFRELLEQAQQRRAAAGA